MNKQGLISELLDLEDSEGRIVPRTAVAWARANPTSQLHAELEWDDAVAGERYRENQVRQLITIFVEPTHNVRQFVSLSIDRVEGGGYRRIDQIMNSRNLRDVLLQDALNDLERCQAKYNSLQELDRVWVVVNTIRKGPAAKAKAKAAGASARKGRRKAPARKGR